MINIASLIQLKAFAQQDGALLSLLWLVGFASMVLVPVPFLNELVVLATPFFVGWRLFKFRNYALSGIISYRRAFGYCFYTFLYSSLIFAVAQGLYFQFLDHGKFTALLNQVVSVNAAAYRAMGIDSKQLIESVGILADLSAIEKAFLFMMQNIMVAIPLSLFIAVFGAKKAPTMKLPEHRNGHPIDKENK
ncbi:DUF4199 domain-containing protein [Hoylesella oralis]|uniref:DUF4199 domain-containing protein n=1 Tax=Hoylesella oralis TaxID=28134 RepID=UPI0028ECC7BA|nr:DUF4199 domain-containing protein [Hoylesella oralis]